MINGRFVSSILSVIGFIFGCIFIFGMYKAIDHPDINNTSFIKELGENWSQKPIISLNSRQQENCNTGEVNLLNDEWPGFETSCLCNNVTLWRGSCSSNLYKITPNLKCETKIQKIALPYKKWQYDYPICTQRQDDDYFKLSLVEKDCPASFPKNCGVADSLKNILCVAADAKCPINDIKITSGNTTLPSGYDYIELTPTPTKVYYTNSKLDASVKIYNKISDQAPCVDPAYKNYLNNSIGVIDYYYDRQNCTLVNQKFEDTEYTKIGNWNYEDLLKANGIYDNALTYFNLMNVTLNHKVNLYGRGYVGMKLSCRETFLKGNNSTNTNSTNTNSTGSNHTNYILDRLIRVKSFVELYSALRRLNYIFCAVIFAFFLLWFTYNIVMKTLLWTRSYEGCFNYFSVITSIMALVALSLSYVSVNQLTGEYTEYLFLKDCLDETSNVLVNNFFDSMNTYKTWLVVGEVMAGFAIFLVLAELFIWCKYKGTPIEERNLALVKDVDGDSK